MSAPQQPWGTPAPPPGGPHGWGGAPGWAAPGPGGYGPGGYGPGQGQGRAPRALLVAAVVTVVLALLSLVLPLYVLEYAGSDFTVTTGLFRQTTEQVFDSAGASPSRATTVLFRGAVPLLAALLLAVAAGLAQGVRTRVLGSALTAVAAGVLVAEGLRLLADLLNSTDAGPAEQTLLAGGYTLLATLVAATVTVVLALRSTLGAAQGR